MSRQIYMQAILEHFKDPDNYGVLDGATHSCNERNASCGDVLDVYLILEEGVVQDVKFEGQGCAISQAAMSMLSEEIKGMNVEEINALNAEYITDLMGIELSPTRLKCALLSVQAVQSCVNSKKA